MVDLHKMEPIPGLQPYPLMFILLEMILHASSAQGGVFTLQCFHMLASSLLPALTQVEAGSAAARVSEWAAPAPGAAAAATARAVGEPTAAAGTGAAAEPTAPPAAAAPQAAAGAAGDLTAAAVVPQTSAAPEQEAAARVMGVSRGTSAPAGKEEGEGRTEGISSSASKAAAAAAAETLVADPSRALQEETAAAGAGAAGELAPAAVPGAAGESPAAGAAAAAAGQVAAVRVMSVTKDTSSSASKATAAEALVADPSRDLQEAPPVSLLTWPAAQGTQGAAAFTGIDALLPLLGAVVACRKAMRGMNLGFEGLAMSLKLQLVVVSHLLRLLHEVVLQIQQAMLVKGRGSSSNKTVLGDEGQLQQQGGQGQQQLPVVDEGAEGKQQQNSRLHEKLLEKETAVHGKQQQREEGGKAQEEQPWQEQDLRGKQQQQQQQQQQPQEGQKQQQGQEAQGEGNPQQQQQQQQGGWAGGIGTVEALQMKADGILWVSLTSLLPVLESLAALWHSVGVLAGNQDCQESARVSTGSSADSELLRVLRGNRGTGGSSSSSSNSSMAEGVEGQGQLADIVSGAAAAAAATLGPGASISGVRANGGGTEERQKAASVATPAAVGGVIAAAGVEEVRDNQPAAAAAASSYSTMGAAVNDGASCVADTAGAGEAWRDRVHAAAAVVEVYINEEGSKQLMDLCGEVQHQVVPCWGKQQSVGCIEAAGAVYEEVISGLDGAVQGHGVPMQQPLILLLGEVVQGLLTVSNVAPIELRQFERGWLGGLGCTRGSGTKNSAFNRAWVPRGELFYYMVKELFDMSKGCVGQMAVGFCCNNVRCVNMTGMSETGLVLSKEGGRVCKGCKAACYCSAQCEVEAKQAHEIGCSNIAKGA